EHGPRASRSAPRSQRGPCENVANDLCHNDRLAAAKQLRTEYEPCQGPVDPGRTGCGFGILRSMPSVLENGRREARRMDCHGERRRNPGIRRKSVLLNFKFHRGATENAETTRRSRANYIEQGRLRC